MKASFFPANYEALMGAGNVLLHLKTGRFLSSHEFGRPPTTWFIASFKCGL